jgi:1-aminocyclopropane-1-carboxylate deaminase
MESPFDWVLPQPSPIQLLTSDVLVAKSIKLYVKRDDLIHPYIQGNKWRKLKYNFIEAQQLGFKKILTFGGAYSNHIVATAAAARLNGFEATSIIRGNELNENSNPTLQQAAADGMKFIFVSREDYRNKDKLLEKYGGKAYAIPEGGTNKLATKGTAEIFAEITQQLGFIPDYVCVPFGTGGTAAGLLNVLPTPTKLLVIMAIKFKIENAINDIMQWQTMKKNDNLILNDNYHFGGYARYNADLELFIENFKAQYNIPIEPIYSAKMFYGLFDLIQNDFFKPHTTIVAIHTGGIFNR